MKDLYIDFDGVIVNTIDITYQIAKEKGIKNDYKSYLEFYKNLNWKDILNKCIPINDSFNKIKKIIQTNKFNISILTHITSLEEGKEKVKFIRKYIKDINIILVPKQISKTDIVKTKNSILIDDYPNNLKEWEEKGGYGIKFDLDKNGKGFPVIDKLDEIINMF